MQLTPIPSKSPSNRTLSLSVTHRTISHYLNRAGEAAIATAQ